MSFHREYLVRLPLPLAQLYSRAHNAKDARGRHDNTFYLFEAHVKLTVAPLVACYLRELAQGGQRCAPLDRLLAQLSLPSFGQWAAMLRELARYFGTRADAASHPLGHLWKQLSEPRKDLPDLLALYRRIKNGADGPPAGDQSVTLLALLESMVQYRNAVFGHGGPRFASFYEQEMGPLLFPAVNELLAEETCQWWGPKGTRFVYLTELRAKDEQRFELGLQELVGIQAERIAPVEVPAAQAVSMAPQRMGILWPGQGLPVLLDPLLIYRETEIAEEVLFLNRELQGRQVQYLSYTTGRTERDKTMGEAMARLLSRITGHEVSPADLERLQEQSAAETPSVESLFEPTAVTGRVLGDYEILSQIGSGGMGVVYLARQLSLGRLVALKMLPADLAGNEVALARFRREMRALARCDHPHIVKVLASGALPDGQLFYAMEYVPGADLEHVWRELSHSDATGAASTLGGTTWARAVLSASQKQREQTTRTSRGDSTGGTGDPTKPLSPPGRGQGEGSNRARPTGVGRAQGGSESALDTFLPPLPELPNVADDPGGYARRVAILIRDAALSLAAVHEQNIVHRDIKPANLMLTPDGQRVVLMDFGLAKGDNQSMTVSQAGGFLGTLRYAAPEQLAAATMTIGPPADIRGLGVVLWELLTRKRLFAEAQDERQLGQWIFDRDVPKLRSVDPTFDRDLEAIVSRATERSVGDRIAKASDLAQYLQMYVDGQPLPIRPPGLGELTKRWVRQHKGLVATAAAAAAAIVITTIVAFALINAAKNDAIAARDEAQRSAKLADEQRNLALDTIDTLVFDVQEQMEGVPALQALKQKILSTAASGLEKITASMQGGTDAKADRLSASAQMKTADILLSMGATQKADEIYHKALLIFERLAEANPNDYRSRQNVTVAYESLAAMEIEKGNPIEARRYYLESIGIREQLAAANPSLDRAQRDLALSYDLIGKLHWSQSNLAEAKKNFQKHLEISLALAEKHPSDTEAQVNVSVSYARLGDVLLSEGSLTGTRENFQKSFEIRQRLAQKDPHETLPQLRLWASYRDFARLSEMEGNLAAGKKYQLQGLEIVKRVADADPSNVDAQRDLCSAYCWLGSTTAKEGDLAGAKKYYMQDLELTERLAKANPNNAQSQLNLAISYNQLGGHCVLEGDQAAAKAYYQQGLEIRQRLAAADRANLDAQQGVATSFNLLGDVSIKQGDLPAAKKFYQQALEIRKALADADPTNPARQRSVSACYMNLADVCEREGDVPGAIRNHELDLEIAKRLAQADPTNTSMQSDLAISFSALGDFQLKQKNYPEAEDCYFKQLEIRQALADRDPSNGEAQSALASAFNDLANVGVEQRSFVIARKYYEKQLAINERLVQANPSNARMRRNLAATYSSLGQMCTEQHDPAEAADFHRRELELRKQLAEVDLSNARERRSLSTTYNRLGDALTELEEWAVAKDCYEQSVKIREVLVNSDPSNVQALRDLSLCYTNLGAWAMKQKDLAAATKYYQQDLEICERLQQLNPTNVTTQLDLAFTCRKLGDIYEQLSQWPDAEREYSKGLQALKFLADAGRLPRAKQSSLDYLTRAVENARRNRNVVAPLPPNEIDPSELPQKPAGQAP